MGPPMVRALDFILQAFKIKNRRKMLALWHSFKLLSPEFHTIKVFGEKHFRFLFKTFKAIKSTY